MKNIFRTAYVYVYNNFAGTLCETDEGYSFSYDENYMAQGDNYPVSLTLPIRKEPYISKTLFSFFDGLIPEGWLLEVVSRNWKINLKDRFALLVVACVDAIGIVSIRKDKI